jgi:hypothetical protein
MKEIEAGNVTRYCKPSLLENGVPKSSAFERRSGEKYLSVHLLDFFKMHTEVENVIEVKKYMEKSFQFKPNGSFAVLNIEQSRKYILEESSSEIYYREEKLPHCGIFHDADDLLIAQLLAECIQTNYPIKDISDSTTPPPSPS